MNAENPDDKPTDAVSLADEDAVKQVLVQAVFGLGDVNPRRSYVAWPG